MIVVRFDGGVSHKKAVYGSWIEYAGQKIHQCSGTVPDGPHTNNVAEYYGLLSGLVSVYSFIHLPSAYIIDIYGDSELIVRQVNDVYKCTKKHLVPLHIRAKKIIKNLVEVKSCEVNLEWIKRDDNDFADSLARNFF